MAKRQRSVSLSFVLLRFAIVMLGCTLLCGMIWSSGLSRFQNTGIVYRGIVPSQQVEKMLAGKPETFHSPGEDFLAEYALFGKNGEVLECNVKGKMLKALKDLLQEESQEADTLRYTYADGSTVIFTGITEQSLLTLCCVTGCRPLNTCGLLHFCGSGVLRTG